MNKVELVAGIINFIIAVACAFISIKHFMEKGFLLNNAYIFASKKERKILDKKPYYRQSAIIFCLLFFVFIIIGISITSNNYKFELLEIPLLSGTLIYTIISSIKIEKNKKK